MRAVLPPYTQLLLTIHGAILVAAGSPKKLGGAAMLPSPT